MQSLSTLPLLPRSLGLHHLRLVDSIWCYMQSGKTAADLAQDQGHTDLVQLLSPRGLPSPQRTSSSAQPAAQRTSSSAQSAAQRQPLQQNSAADSAASRPVSSRHAVPYPPVWSQHASQAAQPRANGTTATASAEPAGSVLSGTALTADIVSAGNDSPGTAAAAGTTSTGNVLSGFEPLTGLPSSGQAVAAVAEPSEAVQAVAHQPHRRQHNRSYGLSDVDDDDSEEGDPSSACPAQDNDTVIHVHQQGGVCMVTHEQQQQWHALCEKHLKQYRHTCAAMQACIFADDANLTMPSRMV